jgi:hypothetical protein
MGGVPAAGGEDQFVGGCREVVQLADVIGHGLPVWLPEQEFPRLTAPRDKEDER